MNRKIPFLNLEFDAMPRANVEAWLADRRPDSRFAYIVTPNVDHIVRLEKESQQLRHFYDQADILLCDSRILAAFARAGGVTIPVTPGSDLVASLFERVLVPGDRVCVIGATPCDMVRMQELYPSIEILHHNAPHGLRFNAAARKKAIDYAASTSARFILLAVGSPQQEMIGWEMSQRADLCGTALCIGASIDFLTGAQRRAPRFLQKMALEWAWRLAGEPRRLAKRYLIDGPRIFPLVLRWHFGNARGSRP